MNTALKKSYYNFTYSAKIIRFIQRTQSSQESLRLPESKLIKGQGTWGLQHLHLPIDNSGFNQAPIKPVSFFYVLRPERWKSVQCNWNCVYSWMKKKSCFMCGVCVCTHTRTWMKHFISSWVYASQQDSASCFQDPGTELHSWCQQIAARSDC